MGLGRHRDILIDQRKRDIRRVVCQCQRILLSQAEMAEDNDQEQRMLMIIFGRTKPTTPSPRTVLTESAVCRMSTERTEHLSDFMNFPSSLLNSRKPFACS